MSRRKQMTEASKNHPSFRHGGRNDPEYRVWEAMIRRCSNENDKSFYRYGGRGIRVCERWRDYANFIADMGKRPSPTHQIDRIDNSGNYEPGNCRWATCKEQARNRRSSVFIEFNGRSLLLIEWAEMMDIDVNTLYHRLRNGWTAERAITAPAGKARRGVNHGFIGTSR